MTPNITFYRLQPAFLRQKNDIRCNDGGSTPPSSTSHSPDLTTFQVGALSLGTYAGRKLETPPTPRQVATFGRYDVPFELYVYEEVYFGLESAYMVARYKRHKKALEDAIAIKKADIRYRWKVWGVIVVLVPLFWIAIFLLFNGGGSK